MKQLIFSIIFTFCLVILMACDERHQSIVDERPIITFSEGVTNECQEFISERLNLNDGVAASILLEYNVGEHTGVHTITGAHTIDIEIGLYERVEITREYVGHYNSLLHFTINQDVEDAMDNSTSRVNSIRINSSERLYEEFQHRIELVDQRVDREAILQGGIPESGWLKFKVTPIRGFCAGEDIFIEINGTRA